MNTSFKQQLDKQIFKWTAGRIAGLGSFIVAVVATILFTVSGMNIGQDIAKTRAIMVRPVSQSFQGTRASFEPRKLEDQIPVTYERNTPVEDVGISKNPEVVLTDEQAQVVLAFDKFLTSRGEWAVVTSGKRTPESQLNIIKEKVSDLGADNRFPRLDEASVVDTKIWMKAWQWLRRKHVPVNAPADVPGANVSMHLKGRAIDFIASDLDQLHSWLASFAKSSYAKQADLRIVGMVREPGCVHINLG